MSVMIFHRSIIRLLSLLAILLLLQGILLSLSNNRHAFSRAQHAVHKAVRMWLTLHPYPRQALPAQVATLKNKEKTQAYNLKGMAPGGGDVVAKRCFCVTGQRERLIYKEILPRAQTPGPEFLGFVREDKSEFCWLFLAFVVGEQYDRNLLSHRRMLADWLARLHTQTQHVVMAKTLPAHDANHYLDRLHNASAIIRHNMHRTILNARDRATLHKILPHLDFIRSRWSDLEKAIQSFPLTMVNADMKAKHIRIQKNESSHRLVVFDWELAGWGFPGVDLGVLDLDDMLDLDVYWQVVANNNWSTVGFGTVTNMMMVGRILRDIAAVFWASQYLEYLEEGHQYKFLFGPWEERLALDRKFLE